MAYYGNQTDYTNAKKANPNADIRLYTPGTKLTATDFALGGVGATNGISNDMLGGAQRIWGATALDTANAFQNYDTNVRPLKDMQTSLQNQQTAQTNLYNQQAQDQALKIKQAIARQSQQGEATKTDYTNQMNTVIGTLNSERAKLPGQTTTLNDTASNTGMINEQKARNALAQMGLLQSGESASQQLLNDTNTSNQINANNLQGQNLNADFGTKIATAQTDLASKVKQINDAISLAQSQGDESSLAVLQDAQAKIVSAGAQSAVDYNNFAYKATQDATQNRMTQQQIDAKNVQTALDNVYRQSQADQAARQFQDTLGLQQGQLLGKYQGQDTLGAQQLTADTAYKNAALAANVAKANSRSSSPSVATMNYYDNQQTSAANNDAFQVLNNYANQGKSRSEIIAYLNQNFGNMPGANYDEVLKRAQNAFRYDKDSSGNWVNIDAKSTSY